MRVIFGLGGGRGGEECGEGVSVLFGLGGGRGGEERGEGVRGVSVSVAGEVARATGMVQVKRGVFQIEFFVDMQAKSRAMEKKNESSGTVVRAHRTK